MSGGLGGDGSLASWSNRAWTHAATPLDAAWNALKDGWRPKRLAVISSLPFSAFGLD